MFYIAISVIVCFAGCAAIILSYEVSNAVYSGQLQNMFSEEGKIFTSQESMKVLENALTLKVGGLFFTFAGATGVVLNLLKKNKSEHKEIGDGLE